MIAGAHRCQEVFSHTVDLESVVSSLTECWNLTVVSFKSSLSY